MFCSYQLCFEDLRLQVSYLQNFFRCLGQRNVSQVLDLMRSCTFGYFFNFISKFIQRNAKLFQHAYSNSFTFTNHPEYQVFRADVIVPKAQRLFPT